MEWILNIIHYVIPFLVLLGVLVFVHEFGHFIVARSLGVSVSAFSIGFGKELWSRTDKKGTVWKISAIPLGGYCQFLGDADESSSTSDVDLSKYTEEEQKHLFATQTPYKKLAIAIAGPLFNYLFAFITFFGLFYFVGSYDIPPIVSEVIKESPAEKAGIIKGDKILEINNQKINDWSDISKEVSIAVNDVNLKIERNNQQLVLTVPLKDMEYAFDESEKPIKRRMIGIKGEAKQFKIIKPKIVVCVGRISAQKLIDKNFKVTQQHGQFIDKNGTLFMGTYHPAAILRNPNNKEFAFADWLALRDKIDELGIEI